VAIVLYGTLSGSFCHKKATTAYETNHITKKLSYYLIYDVLCRRPLLTRGLVNGPLGYLNANLISRFL
jgi:hypothetical protein